MSDYEVSNSEIKTFRHCRRRWWLTYILKLRKRDIPMVGPLPLGSRIHKALELYYKGESGLLEAHRQLADDARLMVMMEGGDVAKLDEEAELGRLMLEGYLDWAEEEGIDANLEVIGVEEILKYPMLDGAVTLIGKIDLRVLDKMNDMRLILDFKPQPISEPIATPTGWRKMGELEVGDYVLGSDFLPTRVLGVYDKGTQPVVLITLDDGTRIRATPDHPWYVINRDGTKTVVESKDLNEWTRIVPITPQDSEDARLPLHPYLLGLWLGDGSRALSSYGDHWSSERATPRRSPVRVTTADQSVVNYVESIAEDAHVRQESQRKQHHRELYTLSFSVGHALDDLGLVERYSHQKFIPKTYMLASYRQRLALLHGLMDSDGGFNQRNFSTTYHTSSPELATDVVDLVRSVGGYARETKSFTAWYSTDGGRKYTRPSHRVLIRMPVNPFKASARAALWDERALKADKPTARGFKNGRDPRLPQNLGRRVVSVVDDGYDDCRCIRVEASDSLYLTTGLTTSHNTAANFNEFHLTGHMNPQLKTYQMLDTLVHAEDGVPIEGGIYRLLKKVKRTGRATPPFYQDITIRHNKYTLRSFWAQLQGVLHDMVTTRNGLLHGGDPMALAYPNPTRDCTWQCPFIAVCPMFDDGSDVETALNDLYEEYDPYGYYETDDDGESRG